MKSGYSRANRLDQTKQESIRQDSAAGRLLTYGEVAEILGASKRTIWTLVQSGDLPAVRFGRSVRIDPRDLEAFIAAAKRGG